MAPFVFHVDLDQFLAAVEVLRRPELRGRPVVVGGDGDPTKRGVVSTASYEARAFGVGSGMPLRTALKRCPDAVFLPVDAPVYFEASRRVMDTLRSFGFVVQVMGWDEAFIAVETDDPEALARDIQRAGPRTHGALVLDRDRGQQAAGEDRDRRRASPRGSSSLTSDRWAEWMGRAADGRALGDRREDGAEARVDRDRHGRRARGERPRRRCPAAFGPSTGPWLARLARGEDTSPVSDAPWIPKGVSRERTFQQDLATSDEVAA